MAAEDTDYSLLVEDLYRHARLTRVTEESAPSAGDLNAVMFRNPERLPYEEDEEGVSIHLAADGEFLARFVKEEE